MYRKSNYQKSIKSIKKEFANIKPGRRGFLMWRRTAGEHTSKIGHMHPAGHRSGMGYSPSGGRRPPGRLWLRLKKLGCYLIIIVLLPYIITVFMNGPSLVFSSKVDDTYVNVRTDAGVLEMPVEEYCIGILAKEIPANYKKEVLEAQAVLVRTDIYTKIQEAGSNAVLEEKFWTQQKMQEAWGSTKYYKYYNKLKDAWKKTEGKVLTYEDKLAKVPFCRLTNGNTRDGKEAVGDGYPYLTIVDCPEDIEAAEQIQTVTLDDMDAEVAQCDTAGYVLSVRVGQETVSGEEFRNTYQLASSCFTIQKYNGKLRITTRGVGHGIGMSQYTANELARDGMKYEEILEYFFKGTKLKEVMQIVQMEKDS